MKQSQRRASCSWALIYLWVHALKTKRVGRHNRIIVSAASEKKVHKVKMKWTAALMNCAIVCLLVFLILLFFLLLLPHFSFHFILSTRCLRCQSHRCESFCAVDNHKFRYVQVVRLYSYRLATHSTRITLKPLLCVVLLKNRNICSDRWLWTRGVKCSMHNVKSRNAIAATAALIN